MQKILVKHREFLITILVTMSLTLCLPPYWNYIYTSPVNVPISLYPAGSVTTQFNVPQGNEYVLLFTFEKEGISNRELIGKNFTMKNEGLTDEKIQKAVGNRYYKTYYHNAENIGIKTGTPISIHWEIRSLYDNSLIQQEIETIGLDSWGQKYYYRNISEFPSPIPNYTMPNFHLSSGKHELKAVISNDIPALAGIKTHIQLIPNPSKDDFILRQLFWFALIALDALLVIVFAANVWRNRTKAE